MRNDFSMDQRLARCLEFNASAEEEDEDEKEEDNSRIAPGGHL
jgi:hypothetical protein